MEAATVKERLPWNTLLIFRNWVLIDIEAEGILDQWSDLASAGI